MTSGPKQKNCFNFEIWRSWRISTKIVKYICCSPCDCQEHLTKVADCSENMTRNSSNDIVGHWLSINGKKKDSRHIFVDFKLWPIFAFVGKKCICRVGCCWLLIVLYRLSGIDSGCRCRLSVSGNGVGCRYRLSVSGIGLSVVGVGCQCRLSVSVLVVGVGCRWRLSMKIFYCRCPTLHLNIHFHTLFLQLLN